MRWWMLLLLAAAVAGKKKHRHHKPGRALLDRLSGTTVSEVIAATEAEGLLPAPLDVAPFATVSANATCGDGGAEEFCRDTPGKRGVVCDVCEGPDGPLSRRHPASHAVDGDPSTWWQSPTLAEGDYSNVELIATLPDKMELLHVIIKAGPSPRPLAWSLEVSSSETAEDWRLVRAFGDRDHCRKLWDLRPERRRRKARGLDRTKRGVKRSNRADKPACSTQFVSQKPLESGEMHVGLGEGVAARRVRVSFRAAHAAPARQQYYTVRALTLAARCLCHGHAAHCNVNNEGAKCDCEHGTCGVHCQRCCNGAAWEPHRACAADAGCACGERGACAWDDSGAILCVNCTENRAGPLCDRCLTGFYNALPDGPCLPCDCDPEGSDGSCKWDRRHQHIACSCLPGFSGALCDACDDPSLVFPSCQAPTTPACKCDPRGVVDPSRVCDDVCECKPYVVGERCDACAVGHFGLSAARAAGCAPCYCSHVTDSCAAAPDGTQQQRDIILPMGEAWLVSDIMGNETVEPSIDDHGKPFLISYEVEGWELYYWLTQAWGGEQLGAYGAELRATMFWGVVRGDTGGSPTVGPDVILVAQDGTKLAFANTSHEQPGQLEIVAPLLEGNWFTFGEESLEPATRVQLMDVLRDLKGVMLRAHFHFDQDEVRLEGAEIRASTDASIPREVCACPAGYGGAWCARCAWGHVRVQHAPGAQPQFECVPCACNGHADCTTVDGPCGECQHNTTGPHCERCLPGHYGNPVQGACKPCACPLYLASNNFSPNCALASAEGDEFVCTQCPDGYTGDHCEHCDFGYWGSPTTPGSSCQPCDCGGSPCHPDTGLCLTCPPHTEGARCDQCEEGYWFGNGTTISGACASCACGVGALAAACDARSGQCACREGFAGRACDRCAEGHGGVDQNCPLCRCGTAALNNDCDAVTGACVCAPGAAAPSCDVCLDDHYGLDVTGCLGCNCSQLGSESNACDIRTGQCRCKPHVTGRACDTCEEGYWGLQHGGCRRCECGAGAAACDPITGMCACAAGVGGAQCDACLPGFYGFGPAGCLQCPKCTDGKVCSPDSGRCVCPPRSRGPGCRQCTSGYYSKPNTLGCHPCRCGPGALTNQCDPQSGQCKCRIGFVGPDCDKCAPGHFGPRCRPCLCNLEGTKGCEDGVCPCDDEGRCPCKENVVGDKCDKCLEGTFGLSADSPSGCTACFCFGRATYCTQASLTRAAVHAATPHHITLLKGDHNVTMDIDKPFTIHPHHPDTTISLPWPPVPVYVVLDKRFLGDRVTSYGGALRFTVEEEGGEELPIDTMALFPLVKIEGNGIELNHYQRIPALNGTYAIRLHESLWEVRGQGALANRPALMAALQNVERILLRVTTRAPTYYDHVHALLLNVSLDTAIPGLSRSEPALGVELCACSEKYSAPSCQEPAIGFWMPKQKVSVTNVAGTIVINLEGDAQPCRCNGRAVACDPKTGACLNCTGGTGGPQCASCAEGYFGSPDNGGCQPCPCPSRTKNFASACAMSAGRLQCLCKPGYTGPECEWCASGFYRSEKGVCVACDCDPRGATSAHCDAHGRCRCRPRAAGLKCSQCRAHGQYMDDRGVCSPCDNCTQTLLDSVEKLSKDLQIRADPTELSRIPKPFPALLEFAHNTSQLQSFLKQLTEDLQNAISIEPTIKNFEEREHMLFTEANRLKSDAAQRLEESYFLNLESMSGLEEVLKQRRKLAEQVAALDDFARGEKHLSAHRALKEARHLLRRIKDVKLIDFLGGATDISDTATLQSTAIQEYDYRLEDIQRRVRKLQAALEEWERKADDLPRLGDAVWSAGDEVAAVEKRVRPKLAAVRDTALRCRLVMEDITSLSANNLTDEIASSLLHGQTLAIKFPSMVEELTALTLAAEEKEGILYNLTPAYKQKYLEPVESHVAELSEKAKQYKRVFSGARSAASLGVSAAHAWGGVADAVKDAREAADTAMAAVTAAATTFSRDSVPKAAASGISASNDLKKRGAELLARSDELRNKLESLHRAADVVSVSLRALGWSERALAERPRARVAETLREASVRADRVFGTTRALYDEAAEVRRRARYNLRRKLADLQRHGDTQLGAAEEHVSQISGNTLRGAELAEALAAAAAARAREHSAASRTIDPALSALKDKIAKAKHAAQSISVSLTSVSGGVGCSRSYAVLGASPAVTRLAVAVSFENQVRDGPMLHLVDDSQDNEKYMKLVVEKKRLRFTWDLGGGEAVIVHPELLQSTHDDADQTSYRIEIERIWNTVHLRLERMGGGTPVSATNTSSPTAVRLTGSQLWLGGRDGSGGLPGCVHALYFDDASVGLWNFKQQPKSAQCTGCTQRWYNAGSRSGMPTLVWFNGAGYAELRRSGLRAADSRQFSVSLTFRTRDQHALLFTALDAANNRSVSLVLRDCRVVFLVQYSSSRLEIAAGGRHCDNQPAHVHAIRLFAGDRLERGSLRVNGEETLGSASPPVQSAAALPDLSAARYWVGGLPPGAAAGDPAGLLGCIGALTVDREGYNLLDTPTRFGVEPTCDNRILRSAVLEGGGYIELPSPAFRRKAALGLTFRARAPDGLLLYRAPKIDSHGADEPDADDKHYLALFLVAGELQMIAAAGKAELKLKTNGTKFDDVRLHSVRIIRAHKQLELWVDEEKVASGTLAGNAYPARSRGLFVGGTPAIDPSPGFPTTGFTGTVADFIIDSQLQGFETAANWSGAQLGRADSELPPRDQPRALQAPPDDTACTKTSSYTVEAGAVKFGDAKWSHAAVRLPPKVKELVISLQFRTYRPDGLLLLAPGSKAKPKHYLALLIREGKLRLVARGRKRRELSLAAAVADGTWRSVTVRVSRSRLSLSSGPGAASAHAPALARAHRLYVGGLPAPPAPHTIPQSIVRLGGFIGCVRRVTVNGRGEDLVRDARARHAVGQCFPNIENAAYFAGDAYATWSNAWSLGSGSDASTEIHLQFRTGEPSGVLLATRGLLLELKDGTLILTRYSWSGEERARVEARGPGGRALCDGAWHHVTTRGGSLSLDAGPALRPLPSPRLALDPPPPAPAPLYLGGLPEGFTEWADGGRENFKGCLRDVAVGAHSRDWRHMHATHSVLLDSCPLQQ